LDDQPQLSTPALEGDETPKEQAEPEKSISPPKPKKELDEGGLLDGFMKDFVPMGMPAPV
jgi:hypothetical protein